MNSTDTRTALAEHIRSLDPRFEDAPEVIAGAVVAFVRRNSLDGYQLDAAREEELRKFVSTKLARTSMYASALAALVVVEFKLDLRPSPSTARFC